MIPWSPNTLKPTEPETAIIAIRPPKDFPDDVEAILLAEVYRWDVRWNCWMAESSGLKLHHDVFWWARESDILADLPA